MSAAHPMLTLLQAGPNLLVQDQGREGFVASGLGQGGAADRRALWEGAALLRQELGLAALEMAGIGGLFEFSAPARIALTGAPMHAHLEGRAVQWGASHAVGPGQTLAIGAARAGVYGYLHMGGGLTSPLQLGSRSAHLSAGIGARLQAGQTLGWGLDRAPDLVGFQLRQTDRFHGGVLRYVAGPQTHLFSGPLRARFAQTHFRASPMRNRQGLRLDQDGEGFAPKTGRSVLSEMTTPGDIQITGDGAPYILLAECQTTGGYPRIGTVLPADLPRAAQAAPGAPLSFVQVDPDEALAIERAEDAERRGLDRWVNPLVRDPRDIANLGEYQLISGATIGEDEG